MGNSREPMRNDRKARENSSDRIDRLYRYAMLVMGILAAVLFLASLVAMVEFPGAFIYLAIGMVATAVAVPWVAVRAASWKNSTKVRSCG